MKLTPFWTDNFPRPADMPTSVLPEQVEVAIIGGGYTGLSAARTFAKSGATVAVLEQNQIGSGASSMNGGLVLTGLKEGGPDLVKHYGPELGRELWEASIEAVHTVQRTVEEEQIDCHLTMNGGMMVAYKPKHYDALARSRDWTARELDYHEEVLIPADKMRDHLGSDAFFGGLLDRIGGGLHPAKYVYGMAKGAAKAGAMLCEQTQVQRVNRIEGSTDFTILTSQGELRASQVLVATNGYTDTAIKGMKRRVFPVGSYMIATPPVSPALQQELSPQGHVFYDTKNFLNYFQLTHDGRVALGGRNDLSTDLDLVESATNLRTAMTRIFPQARNLPITHSWSGKLGITFDLMPHIGQIEGVYYAFGYCGHGVTIATYLGQQVAKLMTGQITRSPFVEVHHPTYFFYRDKPWFLPLAAAFYRVLDRLT
ncbi:FAD-binding oxidoreductase [Anaerolineales bacterium HSG25]|nr:FAD-binding oxidoreductase [Anaerolineales bacterium HSG25]